MNAAAACVRCTHVSHRAPGVPRSPIAGHPARHIATDERERRGCRIKTSERSCDEVVSSIFADDMDRMRIELHVLLYGGNSGKIIMEL